MALKIILCDVEHGVVSAWRDQFARHPEVEVQERSILDAPADAIVNPGNSFGFMDSGLGLALCEKLGFELQEAARKAVRERFGGEMLVGQADVLQTSGKPPCIVYAPTMRTPQDIHDSVNAFLAARAAIRAAQEFNRAAGSDVIGTLAFPGLGTGKGNMDPRVSARQLRYAYEEASGMRGIPDQNLSRCARREKKLKEIPRSQEDSD